MRLARARPLERQGLIFVTLTLLLGEHVIKKGFHIAMHRLARALAVRCLIYSAAFSVSVRMLLVKAPDFEPQPASESVEKGHS